MKTRLLCALLCLCMVLCAIPLAAFAADPLTGTVHLDSGYLKIRSEAPSGSEVGKLYDGDIVTIVDTQDIEGATWYKVTKDNVTGWASAAYIRINYVYETDEDFEAYLTAQKFPEDYKVKLREIHAQYPKWEFVAQHLSMTWATAVAAESKIGKNAVQSPESWKSMEYGAYDWKTGTYTSVDSGGWVNAAPAVVAYFMDPRNFLDDVYVFQFEDLKYSTTHTLDGVKAILPDRFDKYAEDLLKAAADAKVSAYFLATRMTQEGSKIDGTFAKGEDGVDYTGYYNFFNYGAYASNGYGAVTVGAIYAKNQGWDTPYKCLYDSATKIGSGYINKGQNTLYYQKFNVAGENLYNHQYMTNVQAPYSEGRIRSNSATKEEKEGSLTFIIPVYKEMPETAAPRPSETGNNNNFLTSLSIEGCQLSPTFDRYTMEYTGVAGDTVTAVTINAVKADAGATVTGAGTIVLKQGENTIPITVTATSGAVRTYTIHLTAPGGTGQADAPYVTTTAYTVGETISGMAPETDVASFIIALGVKNGKAAVYDANGTKKESGIIATGDIVHLYDLTQTLYKSYPVILTGDANGDGKVNSQDLRRAQRHILAAAALDGYYLASADTNADGKVNSQDLRRTQRYILGLLDKL